MMNWLDRVRRLLGSAPPGVTGQPGEEDLLAWLKQASPAEWHRSAATWNWDQEIEPMQWVIRQPRCDAGTAVTLFARGEPGYYAQFASMDELKARAGYMIETVNFLVEICERWEAGQYATWRFRPDQLPHIDAKTMPWPVRARSRRRRREASCST